MNKLIKELAFNGLIATLYFVLVIVFSFMSYETIQVRVAEVLIFLVLFNRKYTVGITLGCFIANLLGPFGIIDAFVGAFATLLSCMLLSLFKKAWLGIIILPLCNIIVGIEIILITNLSFVLGITTILFVMLGELISGILGFIIYIILKKNETITKYLKG